MKYFFLLTTICVFITSCKEDTKRDCVLTLEKTILGGCNNKIDLRSDDLTYLYENDVTIKVSEDSVYIFVVLYNYPCKIYPFETQYKTDKDVIIMTIIDTCSPADYSCYDRCLCEYSFEFIFKRDRTKELIQKYKLLLIDPQAEEEFIILSEGIIKTN